MFALAPLPRKLGAALRDLSSSKLSVRLSALRDLVRLARTGDSKAAEALVELLADTHAEVRAEAALGLADADLHDQALAVIRVAETDVSLRVRQMALLAIGELSMADSAPALAVLKRARRAEDAAERFQALLSLHQLGAAECEAAILDGMVDADPEVRRLSFRIARARRDEARSLLPLAKRRALAALEDEHHGVRIAAALTLADFGDASGKDILFALVARRLVGASAEDEQAAIELCAELGLTEAKALLSRRAFPLMGRDPLAYDARVALAKMGDDRAKKAILRSLDSWLYDARTLAVAAVGRARLSEARPRLLDLVRQPRRVDRAVVQEALALLEEEQPNA